MTYRDMTEADTAHAVAWAKSIGMKPLLCWGEDCTCENVANWFIPDREGIYCANCRNQIIGN